MASARGVRESSVFAASMETILLSGFAERSRHPVKSVSVIALLLVGLCGIARELSEIFGWHSGLVMLMTTALLYTFPVRLHIETAVFMHLYCMVAVATGVFIKSSVWYAINL